MPGSEPATEIESTADADMSADALPDPATTFRLVLGAIAMQAGTQALTKLVDRAVLGVSEPPMPSKHSSKSPSKSPRKPPHKPSGKVKGFTSRKLASVAIKSIPGAAIVTGGLLLKYVFDRGGVRKQAARDAARASIRSADQK